MGEGLSKPDLATRTYTLAAIFEALRERQAVVGAIQTLLSLITDLQICLEDTFALSNEQKVRIQICL
jgi:hypothetical protein